MNPEESDPEDPDEIPEKLEFDISWEKVLHFLSNYYGFWHLFHNPNSVSHLVVDGIGEKKLYHAGKYFYHCLHQNNSLNY